MTEGFSAELAVDRVHPWVGLRCVGFFQILRGLGWVGFRFTVVIYSVFPSDSFHKRDFSSVCHTLADLRWQLSAAKVECIEIVCWDGLV